MLQNEKSHIKLFSIYRFRYKIVSAKKINGKGGRALPSRNKKNYRSNLQRHYLKSQREKLGLKLEDVAYELKISTDYYAQIENGFRGRKMSVLLLIKIAEALKLDITEAINSEKKFSDQQERMNYELERILSG